MSFKINIGEASYTLTESDVQNLDLTSTGNSEFHVLRNNQSYKVKVIHSNFNDKTMTLEVNGNKYDLQIEDEYDQLVKKMGLSSGGSQKIKNIKAPMPGLILDILVEPGQTVEKGSQLLILEAMKMENVLKAEGEGIVKSIEVDKGEAVDKGQVIIEME